MSLFSTKEKGWLSYCLNGINQGDLDGNCDCRRPSGYSGYSSAPLAQMAESRDIARMAKGGSTLPPKREGAKPRPRKAPVDDIPKCGLPPRKRKAKAPTKPAKATVKDPVTVADDTSGTAAPDWDSAKEAEAAKRAVMAREGRKATVPIDPPIDHALRSELEPGPMGGKLKRTRKVKPAPEPVPEVSKVADPVDMRPAAAKLLERLKAKSVAVTEEIFADICLLVSEGIPLREICRMDGMPSKSTFYAYLEDASDETIHAGRVARYARARALGFDELAAETLEIVDDGSNDYIERRLEDGSVETVLDREHIQRSKLRAEHRLKLLACWDPKRYGAQLKLADPNGERLDRGSMTTSDIAIWISKIAVAVDAEFGPSGPLLEG